MRDKDQRECQGLIPSDRVRAERIAVFFGVLNSKALKFGKTASQEQNGGTWGFPLNPCLQKLSLGQAAAPIPPGCSDFLSLRSESNGELWLQQGAENQPDYAFTPGRWESLSDPPGMVIAWVFIAHKFITILSCIFLWEIVCFNTCSQIMTRQGKFLLFLC